MPSNSEFPSVPTDEFLLTGNPFDPEERGILIGIGGQFTVHDIGNGRVMKIPNSMDGTRRFVGGWGPHVAKMKRHRPLQETAGMCDVCVPHVLRLAARYPALSDALARPRAMPGGCFTQDKVRPLLDLIPAATSAEIRGYLDGYANVCQLCWRYGIHDYIFFFAVNNAIDSQGRVVLLDFGETAFDTTRVAKFVEGRKWERKDALIKETLPPEYHEHYFHAMTSRLSGLNFELHWAADLDDLDRMIIQKPALSERLEEIPSLVDRILERANREEGWDISGISSEVLGLFRQYNWKGSGVELQNVLYRASENRRGRIIQLDDIPSYILAKVNAEQQRE